MTGEALCKVLKTVLLITTMLRCDGLAMVTNKCWVLPLLIVSLNSLIFSVSLASGSRRGWRKTDLIFESTLLLPQHFNFMTLLLGMSIFFGALTSVNK